MSSCDNVLDDWEDIDADKLETEFSNLSTSTNTCANNLNVVEEQKHTANDGRQLIPTAIQLLQRSSEHKDATSLSTATVTSTATNFMNSENSKAVNQTMTNNVHPLIMVLHKSEDEYQSTNYTAPIMNQTVKILRRPMQSSEPRTNEVRPKQPLKSLKQREQEYAEARLRIMGAAKNPEDECAPPNVVGQQPEPTNSNELSINNNITANNAASKTSNSQRNLNGSGTALYNSPFNQDQKQQHQQQLPVHLQQQQQLPQSQLAQYQQNFHYNPQNYYYALQQQQQSYKSLPAYNSNRMQQTPLLGQAPLLHHNMFSSGGGVVGGNGCGPYLSSFVMPNKYQQQQQLQLQQSPFRHKILQQQQQQFEQPKLQQSWSPVVGGKVSYTSTRQQQQHQQQPQQQGDGTLRSPRGPDGTSGFQIRR